MPCICEAQWEGLGLHSHLRAQWNNRRWQGLGLVGTHDGKWLVTADGAIVFGAFQDYERALVAFTVLRLSP